MYISFEISRDFKNFQGLFVWEMVLRRDENENMEPETLAVSQGYSSPEECKAEIRLLTGLIKKSEEITIIEDTSRPADEL